MMANKASESQSDDGRTVRERMPDRYKATKRPIIQPLKTGRLDMRCRQSRSV